MEPILWLLLGETVVVLWLVIIMLIILIWILLRRKTVAVPALTCEVDKTSYLRGETVQITGELTENGKPVAEAEVVLSVISPDPETENKLETVTTDEEGKYESSFTVPDDAIGGSWGIKATALGLSDTATFTLKKEYPNAPKHHEAKKPVNRQHR